MAEARALAGRTAGLHAALARGGGGAAFDPEPVAAADLQRWAAQTRAETAQVLALLQQREAPLPAAQRDAADRLAASMPGLQRLAARAAALPASGRKQRIHGRLRLQEVLRVHDHFVFVDFEGDPARPLADRRRKQSPWRDVAGLLHSFDQAGHAALHTGAHAEAQTSRRAALAGIWRGAVRNAFLHAYVKAAAAFDLLAAPDDLAAAQPLLRLFELDLVLQDLRDELQHRPDTAPAALDAAAALAAVAALADAD